MKQPARPLPPIPRVANHSPGKILSRSGTNSSFFSARNRKIHISRRLLSVSCLLILAVTGCSVRFNLGHVTDQGAQDTGEIAEKTYHTVSKGETLWSISRLHGVTPGQLRTANRLESDLIFPGQELLIPPGGETTSRPLPPPEKEVAEGRPGEYPSIIARRPEEETTSRTYVMPVSGQVISGRGEKQLRVRTRNGEPLRATFDGEIIHAGETREMGPTIIIRHPGNYFSVIGGDIEIMARKGAETKKGAMLGRARGGNDGAPVVFLEIRRQTEPVDPAEMIASPAGDGRTW